MADMQAGIGPFLGVFLRQRGWATSAIGLVMIARAIGYGPAFVILGSFAVGSLAIWLVFAQMLKSACASLPQDARIVSPGIA